MPISSGANRWPKSYWTKPMSPDMNAPLRYINVAERPSLRRSRGRTMSLPTNVHSPSKVQDARTHAEPSSPSDSELERPALRPQGVVLPPLVERLAMESQDDGDDLTQEQRSHNQQRQHAVLSDVAVVKEISSTRLNCPLPCTSCMRTVRAAQFDQTYSCIYRDL